MNNFWLKLKLWSKAILFGLIGLYVVVFLAMNWEARIDRELNFVFTKFNKPKVLLVLLATAIVSVIGWWLLRTVIGTFRQFREVRERGRTSKLEKEVAEMKAKVTPTKETVDP